MNIFKAAFFAGMLLASQATAQTFGRFHSGVNLSVTAGGSDRSAAPLDMQEAANAQRVAEAADIGFDFLRLRVSLAPWTDTGSTADQQKALTLANGIVQQALAHGMRVDVVMMAGSLSTTTAAGLICTANPSAVAAWTAGWLAVLALLPDTFHLAFEPLNEPPNCAEGNRAWDAAQLSVYHQVRALRRAVKFVVYGHHWGDNIGTDFTTLDPTPYLGDTNVLFTFHYYDPFAFTGQGLSWLLDGRYRYLTGLTWPYATANAHLLRICGGSQAIGCGVKRSGLEMMYQPQAALTDSYFRRVTPKPPVRRAALRTVCERPTPPSQILDGLDRLPGLVSGA
jgi:hypothetical protein